MRKALPGFLCLALLTLAAPPGAGAATVEPTFAPCTPASYVLPASTPLQPGKAQASCKVDGTVVLSTEVASALGGAAPAALIDAYSRARYTLEHTFDTPDVRRTITIRVNVVEADADGSGTSLTNASQNAQALALIRAEATTREVIQGTNVLGQGGATLVNVSLDDQGHQSVSGPVVIVLEQTSSNGEALPPTTADVRLDLLANAHIFHGPTGVWKARLTAIVEGVTIETT